MYDFTYQKPATLADALKAVAVEDAKAMAGGMTLIPVLKQRLNRPSAVGVSSFCGSMRETRRSITTGPKSRPVKR